MRTSLACLTAALSLGTQAVEVSGLAARQPPDWVRDGIIYEINPRAFSATGNFAGITAKLDDLKQLGVTILWLMPIQPPGVLNRKGTYGSPYAVRDYDAINPDYGTATDLKKLVRAAHRRGFKVIIDIVANHTAWDSVLMKHPEYYKKDARGRITSPVPDWADVAGLDYSNPKLREYMISMLERWLREVDLDGFRCDVAGMVPTDFWEQARPRLERVKPDLFMLAEWDSPDLLVKAFDLDYAWRFHKMLTKVLQAGEPASALRVVWEEQKAKFPRGALHMVFSDNHDEKRAIARFGEGGALAASALVFSLEGVPMLYNGMEVGDTTESGAPALFERLPVFWAIGERRPEFRRTYETLIRLRAEHPALRRGDLKWLSNDDEAIVVSFVRRNETEEVVGLVNLSNRPRRVRVAIDSNKNFRDLVNGTRADKDGPQRKAWSVDLEAWAWRWYGRPVK
jgi:cyclomaltodextrinase / maltogenic alpha-amylase / neopullulanase